MRAAARVLSINFSSSKRLLSTYNLSVLIPVVEIAPSQANYKIKRVLNKCTRILNVISY